MAADNEVMPINEQVLEIRYKPEARVLDHRGTWADQLQHQFNLSEWQITENRVDVYDKENSKRLFIAFRNAGCTLRNSGQTSFIQLTQSFLRFLFRQSFFRTLQVERIGVLGRFARRYNGSFENLLRIYKERVYSIRPEVERAFAAELVDIGSPLDFRTAQGEIHSATGPMKKEQLRQFFDFVKEPPDVALYFQIDYFLKPDSLQEMNHNQVIDLVASYIEGNWIRYEHFSELIDQ
jgi:hypothetical protein